MPCGHVVADEESRVFLEDFNAVLLVNLWAHVFCSRSVIHGGGR